jgi:hypothetical protein
MKMFKEEKHTMVRLCIPCEEHGEHIVYLASQDDMSEQLALFIQHEFPFPGITYEEHQVTVTELSENPHRR